MKISRYIKYTIFIFLISALSIFSQSLSKDNIANLAKENLKTSVNNLKELLSIPNVAFVKEDIWENINYVISKFKPLGFNYKILPTEGNPQLFIEKIIGNKLPTVLFYMQLDGQPVDSSKWAQPDPFTPVLKKPVGNSKWNIINWNNLNKSYNPEWRVFARTAADAKGPIAMFLSALEILQKENITSPFNIKGIFDTEEELGSPHLLDAIKNNKELLKANYLVVLDGPRHISNLPTLIYGARGIITMQLKVFGPRVPQHSGHYGNYAPNPAFRLAQLLSSMKDENGRVLLPGYYDDVKFNDETKKNMNNVPDDENEIKKRLGITEAERVGNNYQESIQYPSLNIDGLQSAWVGDQTRTIVPASATAAMDIRLVPESDPQRLINLVKHHIAEQGYHFVNNEPTEEERMKYDKLISFNYQYLYPAFRTDFGTPIDHWLTRVMKNIFRNTLIKIRQAGGSVPISFFIKELDVPAVLLAMVNMDDNQHSPNENLRLGNYFEGIQTCLSLLTTKIKN